MNKTILAFVAVVLLLGSVTLSCSARPKVDDRVVMKAGDIAFTMHDLGMYMARFSYRDTADELFKKQDFLEQHLDKLLIADAGLELGLGDSVVVDSEQVARILSEIVYKRKVADRIRITPEAVRKFWEVYGGEIKVSQILLLSQEFADSLHAILKDKPDLFAEMARQHSVDSVTSFKGGELGTFRVGQMEPPIQEAAFRLTPGQVSEPIETGYGWHLVKLEERARHTEEDFEKEKGSYRALYTAFERSLLEEEYIRQMSDRLHYKFHDDVWRMLVDKAALLKKSNVNQAMELSFYVSKDDLMPDEASMPIVSIDGLDFTAAQFLRELSKFYPYRGYAIDRRLLAEGACSDFMLTRLMYVDGLQSGVKDDPEFADQVEDTRLGLVYRLMLDRILAEVTVTQEEIRDFYEKNKQTYADPPKIKVSEILLSNKEEAERILEQLKHGEPFSELVKLTIRPGFDQTAGNLGYVDQRRMGNVYQLVKDLKVGDYAGPVLVDDNWAVYRITDRKSGENKSLAEMEGQISTRILGMRKYNVLQQWLEKRKQEVENSIDLELLKANLETGKANES